MKPWMSSLGPKSRCLLAVLLIVALATTGLCRSDRRTGTSATSSESNAGTVPSSDPSEPVVPDPYKGQKTCPVCGGALGAKGPAVLVNTDLGAEKPSFIGKLFGKKEMPGLTFHVCSPECAAKAHHDPVPYYFRVVQDRAGTPKTPSSTIVPTSAVAPH